MATRLVNGRRSPGTRAATGSAGSGPAPRARPDLHRPRSIIAGNTSQRTVELRRYLTSQRATTSSTRPTAVHGGRDIVADPQLGSTPTARPTYSAIAPTSPAIDRAGACTGADQRDLPRPQGAACDSGAYEVRAGAASATRRPDPAAVAAGPAARVQGDRRGRRAERHRQGPREGLEPLRGARRRPRHPDGLGDRRAQGRRRARLRREGRRRAADREFFEGIFKVTQSGGVTVLTLTEKLSCGTAEGRPAAAKKVKKRRLWGDGKGKFRTKGKHSAATVVGTKWLVADTLHDHAHTRRARQGQGARLRQEQDGDRQGGRPLHRPPQALDR